MPYAYDRRSSSFRDTTTGRFVSDSVIEGVIDQQVLSLDSKLKGIARQLVGGGLDIPSFQRTLADELKKAHIRSAAIGAGGRQGLTQSIYGGIGAELKKQYKRLAQFGQDIADGKLSEKQIIARAGQYSRSAAIVFERAKKQTRIDEGFVQGKRSLDPYAQHCPECLRYTTKGQWVSISEIVPAGTNCSCGGRCRCIVRYRKR